MDLSKWKQEKDLLEEAYDSLYSEAMKPKKEELTPREKEQLQKAAEENKKGEDPFPGAVPKDREDKITKEETDLDAMNAAVEMPDTIEDVPVEPDEVDAEIDSLKSLLQNPDPERIEQYASEGRLEDYITMLQKKLDAAKAVKDVVRGKDGG